MSVPIIFTLLALALVLPLVGAFALRILGPRLSPPQAYGTGVLLFAIAAGSVLALARSDITSLQVGGLSLLLSASGPADDFELPPLTIVPAPDNQVPGAIPEPAPADRPPEAATAPATSAPPEAPTAAPTTNLPTRTPTQTPAEEPTTEPTPTEEPTPEPTEEPTPTPEPTEEPTPTSAPATTRTYVVEEGDTLRGIAEQFDVSVQALLDANDLSPEDADALRIGQELVIPEP